MAISLSQGGSGFPCLYEGVFQYLCGKTPDMINVDYKAIPDFDLRTIVDKVSIFKIRITFGKL